jgi:zinc protease
MRHFLSLLLLFCFVISEAQKITENSPVPFSADVVTGTLPNGMKYYIRQNNKPEKRAELRLVVNVGSNMEDDNQQGLAHFLEHMAFNGTKNFKKNELVDYLESVGTKFGPHLNAYTSFDETVYMLQIPTDKPEILNKGFQILEDWAHNLAFDSLEVEKERGVVIEEWRLRKGAGDRMMSKYFPVLYKDSRYAERLPIGKKDILETFRHDVLKKFYRDWYRPELMAVIVVGDVDPKAMEKKIKAQFSGIPKSKTPRKRNDWPLPDHDGTLISVATDKEATNTSMQIVFKHPLNPAPKKIGDLKTTLMSTIFSELITSRFSEIGRKANAPFAYAWGYFSDMVRTKNGYTLYAVVKDGMAREAMEVLLRENRRIIEHGFTQSELDRVKKSMQVRYESEVKEKGKTESSRLTYNLINNFLSQEPVISEENWLKIFLLLKDKITLAEMNALAPKWTYDNKNTVIVITAPEKENVKIPSESEFLKYYIEYSRMKTTPYIDNFIAGPLVKKVPEPGKIISEEKNESLGIVTWKLSNGAIVRFKKTDFKNDEIVFSARSKGGFSQVSDADYLTARFAANIISESGLGEFSADQLEKFTSDKVAYVYPSIGNTYEGLSGACSPKDLDVMMQMIYLYFNEPRKDEEAYKAFMEKQKAFLVNRSMSPSTPYSDTMVCVFYNYHNRIMPLSVEKLEEVKLDAAFRIYLTRFQSAADFTFYFVGNIDEVALRDFVTRYLGSSPPAKVSEIVKDNKMRPASGLIEREIRKGVEQKSNVTLRIWNEHAYSVENSFQLAALMKLLGIKLRENLREDKSGVYGVGASGYFQRYPMDHYMINISFGCAPENVKMLIQAAMEEIEKIKANGCDEKDLVKVKETFRRERETEVMKNEFWLNQMVKLDEDNLSFDQLSSFVSRVDALSSESMKTAAVTYLNLKNYSKFILNPEK